MQQSQKTGFDVWIKKALSIGKIYIGSSAGSQVAAKDLSFRFKNEDVSQYTLKSYYGYGLVDFAVIPHWGRKDFKAKYQKERFNYLYNEETKLLLLSDNQYIKFVNGMYQIISVK